MDSGNGAPTPREDITGLLGGFRQGDPDAEARLLELTYRELRKIAAGHLRREHSARSLQTTEQVHEGYLKLVDQAANPWRDRGHFYQAAAHVMRQILIDHARKRKAGKRGGGAPDINLDLALDIASEPGSKTFRVPLWQSVVVTVPSARNRARLLNCHTHSKMKELEA